MNTSATPVPGTTSSRNLTFFFCFSLLTVDFSSIFLFSTAAKFPLFSPLYKTNSGLLFVVKISTGWSVLSLSVLLLSKLCLSWESSKLSLILWKASRFVFLLQIVSSLTLLELKYFDSVFVLSLTMLLASKSPINLGDYSFSSFKLSKSSTLAVFPMLFT